jgi:ketosteroid isomerase-like protein
MGPTDEELINTTMNSWKQAIIDNDVDAILAGYSEDFSSERVEGKDQMREFMEGAIDQGWLENIDINLEIAQLTITDDTAEFAPVEIIGDNGEMELNFTLKKEDKKIWRIISSGAQR